MALRQLTRASIGFLFLVAAGAAQHANAQNWDGAGQIRFGTFLQGASTDFKINQSLAGSSLSQSASPSGIGGGVVTGYDLHIDRLVLGFEADVAWDGQKDKVRPPTPGFNINYESYGVNYTGSLRGRVGFMVHPSFMVYGTAGLGFMGTEYKADGLGITVTASTLGGGNKKLATLTGTTFGGGGEYDMGWGILFGEYLHTDYGKWHYNGFDGALYNVDTSNDIWRVGLKFKIGHDFDHDYYAKPDGLK